MCRRPVSVFILPLDLCHVFPGVHRVAFPHQHQPLHMHPKYGKVPFQSGFFIEPTAQGTFSFSDQLIMFYFEIQMPWIYHLK